MILRGRRRTAPRRHRLLTAPPWMPCAAVRTMEEPSWSRRGIGISQPTGVLVSEEPPHASHQAFSRRRLGSRAASAGLRSRRRPPTRTSCTGPRRIRRPRGNGHPVGPPSARGVRSAAELFPKRVSHDDVERAALGEPARLIGTTTGCSNLRPRSASNFAKYTRTS